jgi:hypothetical protein
MAMKRGHQPQCNSAYALPFQVISAWAEHRVRHSLNIRYKVLNLRYKQLRIIINYTEVLGRIGELLMDNEIAKIDFEFQIKYPTIH